MSIYLFSYHLFCVYLFVFLPYQDQGNIHKYIKRVEKQFYQKLYV